VKIALFFTFGISLKEWKETGLFSREVAPYLELVKRGHEVVFITYGQEDDMKFAGDVSGIIIEPIFKYYYESNFKIINIIKSFCFVWKRRDMFKKMDVYKSNQMLGAWLPIIAGKIFKKPILGRVGYDLFEFYSKRESSNFKLGIVYLISKLTYKFSDHVLITSAEGADFIQKKFNIPKDKVSFHFNYVDTKRFSPTSLKKEKSILYVGRLDNHKNLFPVIDAVMDLNIPFYLVGSGDEEEKIKRYVREKKINVFFFGRLPNEDLPRVYNEHQFFILNSYSEGNPKALLEAMSCGCCPVGNNVAGIKSIIVDGKNGMFTDGGKESIKKAITQLLNNNVLVQTIAYEAREYIVKHCSLSSMIDFELSLYKKIKDKNHKS